MNPKQERFVAEYLVDLNATKAAIRAGYSKKTAESQGSRLLSNAKVSAAIDAGKKRIAAKLEVTAERVIAELGRIAFADFGDIAEWGPHGVRLKDSSTLTEDQRRSVAEVSETTTESGGSLKIRQHDKKGALDSLGKYFKLFTDKVEHTGADGLALLSSKELVAKMQEAAAALLEEEHPE